MSAGNSRAVAARAMRAAPQTRFRVAPIGSDAGLAMTQTMGTQMNYDLEAARLKKDWAENPRWKGIERGYSAEDVVRLRGSVHIEHTLARRGAEKLWKLVNEEPFVNALGAMTGNQAMQQVKAGLEAIYLSGWQVAADANNAGEMYPDQSLYPSSSVPDVVRRINKALQRADQIAKLRIHYEVAYKGRIPRHLDESLQRRKRSIEDRKEQRGRWLSDTFTVIGTPYLKLAAVFVGE
jgi:osmotically-inducible protein OsmY